MRKLLAVLLVVGAAACSVDTPAGPLVGDISGTYTLRSMNGSPLPFVFTSNDTTVSIDTDVLTVVASGDWSETVGYRQTVGTAAATNETLNLVGSWTRNGNQLNFRTSLGLLYVGTATETSLNLSDAGFNYVFTR
jgi:hypothetical protein